MQHPLLSCWKLSAPSLPDELLPASAAPGFALPGALDLLDFADLLGEPDGASNAQDEVPAGELPSAPFPLPALLPDSLSGEATLSCPVDFGALRGDHAVLTFQHLLGSGSILLGETPIAAFNSTQPSLAESEKAFALSASPCGFAVDLTDALRRARTETLSIRFGSARPAGVCGAIFLQTTQSARLSRLTLTPDAARRTIAVRAKIIADQAGDYALRVLPAAPSPAEGPLPAREITLSLASGESRQTEMTLTVPGERFVPGHSYAMPTVKVQLFRLTERSKTRGVLCDSAALACGYPGRAPLAFVPLQESDAQEPPDAVARALRELHIPGVRLHAPAPESFYLAMTRASIGIIQQLEENSPHRERLARHPSLTFAPADQADSALSPAASAWQLCGMTGYARAIDPDLSDRALLHEAAGRALDPLDEGVRDVLGWLRAVAVRLRCEAARQGRYSGALCEAGQWREPDAANAIRTAFSPLHLSALPLCGAWWTGTRFSAVLEAFIPEGEYAGKPPCALAVLEDDEGRELARLLMPCRAKGGYIGVIDAQLPDFPCVLELRTQLLRGDEVIEESTMPVYVGERGPLEAAFVP